MHDVEHLDFDLQSFAETHLNTNRIPVCQALYIILSPLMFYLVNK